MLSLRQNKRSRRDGGHAPPQRHLKSRERGDRKGANGGKREGERSERESVVPRLDLSLRQNKDPSFPGHAPGKDTLRAANAATKEGFTGRKRVKRKRLPVVFPSTTSQSSPRPSRGSLPFCDGRNNRANSRCSRESRQSRCPEFPPKQAELL